VFDGLFFLIGWFYVAAPAGDYWWNSETRESRWAVHVVFGLKKDVVDLLNNDELSSWSDSDTRSKEDSFNFIEFFKQSAERDHRKTNHSKSDNSRQKKVAQQAEFDFDKFWSEFEDEWENRVRNSYFEEDTKGRNHKRKAKYAKKLSLTTDLSSFVN
jgi:hypothetical protein